MKVWVQSVSREYVWKETMYMECEYRVYIEGEEGDRECMPLESMHIQNVNSIQDIESECVCL